MSEQLSFDGFEAGGKIARAPAARPSPDFSEQAEHGFFLALRLGQEVQVPFSRLGAMVKRGLGLKGRLRPAELLHVTLFSFGGHEGPEEGVDQVLDAVKAVCDGFTHGCFDARFDRVMSFERGAQKKKAIVAVGGEGVDALLTFQRELGARLRRAGLPVDQTGFKPHVTLLYDSNAVPVQPVAPIAWTVRDFALVHSNIGRSRYDELGRWALRAPD